MHKKLRLRFLLTIWALLLLFLTAVSAGVSIYMYQTAVSETESALRKAVETESLTDETRGMLGVRLDHNGKMLSSEQRHLSLSDETVEALVDGMEMKGEQTVGEIELDGMRYRYMSVTSRGGAWAAVAECSQEMTLIKTLWRNSAIFVAIGALLLIPVSILLARWVSKPIEAAWEKQNDFVSDATHELKTPLTVIAADTEAVLSNPDASIGSQEKWLGSIKDETTRMAGLVGDLLFLAKIDAGEIHPDVQEIDLSDMLEGMCMERESEVFETGQHFDYDITPKITYRGDRRRLEQMMDAMFDNAVKYTPKGGTIRMVLARTRKKEPRIVLSNTGTPIPAEDIEKIFDRFYRVDPSRARNTGGYGLGLCVARSIAELHGGTITAESDNGINVFTTVLGEVKQETEKKKKGG